MHQFQRLGIFFVKIDACDARVVHLSEELAQVGAALVPHPCLGEESAAQSGFEDTYGEVDVLAEAHLRESAQLHVSVASHAHVERAWVELVELLLSAAYATGGEERGHGVGYGFLSVGERRVRAVRTAKGIGRLALQLG